ncbi:MAG TPA: plastocyanin/azurin family copper-binding protein [Solirubrobacteraceae bacterium]|nr:plastocyanin/azurin family copper-binding protein [Solirubrobacteraceae bacterium]
MHTIALQLTPELAAEKSKVAFYIAGGVLVVWALTLSLGIGMRRPGFPGSLAGQRAIMAVSAVLVIAALATAVLTSGTPAKGSVAPASTQSLPPVPVESAPTASAATSTATSTSTSTEAKAAPPPAPASKASSSLRLAANPKGLLSYNTKVLNAKAGTVTITMTNMSPLEHNVTIAEGSKVLGATPTFVGGSRTLTLKLKPGRYTFYCSVPGHRQAGMEGTLNVS